MSEREDDRVLPFTIITAAGVVLVLVLAFLALYIEPDHTDANFAWTILPRSSAILIGAGYTGGAYFFIRLLTDRKWHRVQAGFLPITAFTICMLAATVLHLNRFHQGDFRFYLWTGVYILTPFLVPFLWWRNRATERHDLEENDLRFSAATRLGMRIFGVAGILAFLVVFAEPSILIASAPWKLTELTARIFAGWSILTFAAVLSIGMDGRWSATRILVESAMVAIVLVLFAVPRMWSDLDLGKPMTYAFMGGLVLALAAFLFIHIRFDRASRKV